MNSHYNIFVGTENGLLKGNNYQDNISNLFINLPKMYYYQGINSKSKTFNNLNNIENLSKDKEILAMCWVNDSNQDQVRKPFFSDYKVTYCQIEHFLFLRFIL
jgi:hypothetical protein